MSSYNLTVLISLSDKALAIPIVSAMQNEEFSSCAIIFLLTTKFRNLLKPQLVWGAVSDLSLISGLSEKFKHDLWRLKSKLNFSQKQHLTPGQHPQHRIKTIICERSTPAQLPTMYTEGITYVFLHFT